MSFFSQSQIEQLKASKEIRCAFLTELNFKTQTVRLWNGNTPKTMGGNEWLGMRGAGEIDGLNFNGTAASEKFTLRIPGIQDDSGDVLKIALSETEVADQQIARVFLQFFDSDWETVGNPLGVAWGFMQKPKVQRTRMEGVSGSVQTISIEAENIFFNRAKPPAGRYTDRDQQTRFNNDLICQFTPELASPGKLITYPAF